MSDRTSTPLNALREDDIFFFPDGGPYHLVRSVSEDRVVTEKVSDSPVRRRVTFVRGDTEVVVQRGERGFAIREVMNRRALTLPDPEDTK